MATSSPLDPSQPSPALLQSLERAFAHLSGDDAAVDVKELQRALGLRAEYLARRVLSVFDLDGDGVIRRDEFLEGVRKLLLGSPRDLLQFAFRLHDGDGDGSLDRLELTRMVTLALAEDDVSASDAQVDRLVAALLWAADADRDGRLSFQELEAAVGRRPHLLARMTRDAARWLAPNEDLLDRVEEARGSKRRRGPMLESGWAPAVFVGVWALANVALLATGMLQKARPGHPVDFVSLVSRATTTPIELDGAIILFPVMRRLLTWVRRTWLGRVVPVDEAVGFHRIVGHTLFALCAVHGAAVLVGYGQATKPILAQLASERALTGTALMLVFTVMWVCAWQVVRRSQRFELFYFTHLLYVVWFGLAIAHAPGILAASGLGLVGLGVELSVRAAKRGKATAIVSLHPLRSGVTRLELRRPPGFTHHPGDYLFLRVPAVARHEWHPLTISSAPESAALTVHVRSLGNWSSALRRLAEAQRSTGPVRDLPAHVDGPYGSPTGHVFESRFAVLIGAGIGVTPFASILESIVLRANGRGERRGVLEKAHFFWLNRDRYSFEWFAALLAELERRDGVGVLDVNIWMTGGRAGAESAALELAREAAHDAGDRDIFTGLRTRTRKGQPDWGAELQAIAQQHAPAKVDVFFCGPPGLGRTIRREATRLGMRFRDEKF
jgi:predicted ferric reductase/Ca2+-binding EF-hand superfamily protein